MVFLHYKKSEANQFLYETKTSILIKDLIVELVKMNNTRLKLDRLSVSLQDLANLGPQKPEQLRGLQDYDEYLKNDDLTVKQGIEKLPARVGDRTKVDETHHRTGWVLEQSFTEEMMEIAAQAKKAIHKNQVDMKQVLTMKTLEEHIQLIRGVIMKNYPGYHGLGDWEPVRVLLEDEQEKLLDKSEDFNAQQATLWFAGKELLPSKILSDYCGKNQKSKIIVKLQKKGAGAPQRQPLIDEATHKSMLSYYHKKQEQAKKLQEDNEDNYMNSPWADPKGLKNQLHGVSSVSWK